MGDMGGPDGAVLGACAGTEGKAEAVTDTSECTVLVVVMVF